MASAVFGLVAIGLLLAPVWRHGDDSGWYRCGGLLDDRRGLRELCEFDGLLHTRLVMLFAALLAAATCWCVAIVRERSVPVGPGLTVLVVASLPVIVGGTALWRQFDDRYVSAIYDYSSTVVDVGSTIVPGAGRSPIDFRITGWPSRFGPTVAACNSALVPAGCDLEHAVPLVRPGSLPVSVDDTIDVAALLDVGTDDVAVVLFDHEMFAVPAPWPAGSYVAIAIDVADAAPGAAADPAIAPEGFDLVAARVTAADGTVCELCVWLAESSQQRSQGLMYVTDLGDADAMAFRYPAPHTGAFWMKNTVLPLSIAFFDADGGYLDAFDMPPCTADPCPTYPTAPDFVVALELPHGQLTEFKIAPGSALDVTDLPCT